MTQSSILQLLSPLKLKVICQVCGKATKIDTSKPIGPKPRWESYRLEDFGLGEHAFSNYEIWICDQCHEKTIDSATIDYDETGEPYDNVEYDWEKLTEMVMATLVVDKKQKEEPH